MYIKNTLYKALRWSERYTKTDMIYLGRGGFWLSIGQCINAFGGLILAVAFANLVSQDIYGNYKFILSLAGIITAFSLTGLGTAVVRATAQGFEHVLRDAVRVHFIWSIGIVLISFGISAYYFFNQNSILGTALLIIGVTLPIITSTSHYEAFLSGKKEFKTKALFSIVRNLFPIASLLLALYITDNIITLVLVYFISQVFVTSALYLLTLHRFKPTKEHDDSSISYGKHLSVMNVLSSIAMHIDKILVFHFIGAAALAIYAFALAVPRQIGTINKMLSVLIFPKLSTKNMEQLQKTIPFKALLLFFFMLCVCAIYIILAPYIYKILFPQYVDAVFYSQIYAITFLLFPAILFEDSIKANKKIKDLYVIKTITPIFRITLLLILAPLYGILGVLIGVIISRIFSLLVLIYFFYKKNPQRPVTEK